MDKIKFLSYGKLLLLFIIIITGCKDKKDDPIDHNNYLTPVGMDINKFIWSGLHNYYLWVDNVPSLAFSSYKDEADWTAYLNKYLDHENLFNTLLFKQGKVDKWSWIVDDYEELENQFQGITKSMGYNFGLAKFTNSTEIFGYVRYVVPGSPAENAGIKRGDIFIGVNDQILNETNYQYLLFGNESYTLSMAYISGNSIYPSDRKIALTATEIHENPIFFHNVYSINNLKIGYLVYNGFMSDYDLELNDVFKGFKAAGVQKLILDLRYNPGGSVQSAIYLASMIYGTHTDEIFMQNQYNTELGDYIRTTYGEDYSVSRFTDIIEQTENTPETPISALNLNEVCIITTSGTASASELVINGLRPYMNVIEIGDTTFGKYVGSMTIKDYNDKGVLNPDHKYALQPITMKAANSLGYTDFVYGLIPDILQNEDLRNFSELGNTDELLLSIAINSASGITQRMKVKSNAILDYRTIADSKDLIPHGKEMYFNKKKIRIK